MSRLNHQCASCGKQFRSSKPTTRKYCSSRCGGKPARLSIEDIQQMIDDADRKAWGFIPPWEVSGMSAYDEGGRRG